MDLSEHDVIQFLPTVKEPEVIEREKIIEKSQRGKEDRGCICVSIQSLSLARLRVCVYVCVCVCVYVCVCAYGFELSRHSSWSGWQPAGIRCSLPGRRGAVRWSRSTPRTTEI